MATRSLFPLLLCGVLLGGCAALAPSPSASSSNPVAPYRAAIELSGRLLVNYQKDGKSESLSGAFAWQQSAQRTDVSLSSPTGQTVAVISVTPALATLRLGGQPERAAADIDTLTAQALGFPLPVSGLRDWLQGYAVDAAGARFVASPARDRVTTRDGWRLRYASWQDAAAAAPQPKRIDAERSVSSSAEPVEIRIVLNPPVQP